MLEKLFGSLTAEKVLFFMCTQKECYATQIANLFNVPVNMVQKQLFKFEEAGIFVSSLKGKTRLFLFNPRYPFLKELLNLLEKAFEYLPEEEKNNYLLRKRPRRTSKPL